MIVVPLDTNPLAEQALLRVARCRRASRKAPPVMTGGARGRGMGRDKKSVQPAAAVVNALQVFGEALEEIVVHGGGEVEAVTNEPKLSDILKVSAGVGVRGMIMLSFSAQKICHGSAWHPHVRTDIIIVSFLRSLLCGYPLSYCARALTAAEERREYDNRSRVTSQDIHVEFIG